MLGLAHFFSPFHSLPEHREECVGLGCFPSLFSASSPRFSQVSIVSTPASFTLICSLRDRRGPRCTRTAQPTGSQRASSSFTLSWSSGLCLRSVPRSVRMALIYGRHLPNLLISSERELSFSSFVTKLLILEGVEGIACSLLCHGSAAPCSGVSSQHMVRKARPTESGIRPHCRNPRFAGEQGAPPGLLHQGERGGRGGGAAPRDPQPSRRARGASPHRHRCGGGASTRQRELVRSVS